MTSAGEMRSLSSVSQSSAACMNGDVEETDCEMFDAGSSMLGDLPKRRMRTVPALPSRRRVPDDLRDNLLTTVLPRETCACPVDTEWTGVSGEIEGHAEKVG